jgi:hypothetical protein
MLVSFLLKKKGGTDFTTFIDNFEKLEYNMLTVMFSGDFVPGKLIIID